MSDWTPEKMAFRRKAPPKRKPRKRPVARRVTRQRQAYRKKAKSSMMMKRQPFVETKKAVSMQADEQICNVLMTPSDATH